MATTALRCAGLLVLSFVCLAAATHRGTIDVVDAPGRLGIQANIQVEALPEDYDSTASAQIGHDPIWRKSADQAYDIAFVDLHMKFQKYGFVESWAFYTYRGGDVFFQIYRPGANQTFTLMCQNEVTARKGLQTALVDPDKKCSFEAGDVVGWRLVQDGALIAFDFADEGECAWTKWPQTTPPTVGSDVFCPHGGARTYSIQANYKYWPRITFKPDAAASSVAKLGHAITARTEHDDAQYVSFVDLSLKSDYSGPVEAWEVFAARPGTLKIQIYSKMSESEFMLLDENTVEVLHSGLQFFPIPQEEQLLLDENTFLGWRYEEQPGIVAYSDGPPGLVMWAELATQTVGQNATFLFGDARTYSIAAIFQKDLPPTSAPDSEAYGPGLREAVAGQANGFQIQSRDARLRNQTTGDDPWRVFFQGPVDRNTTATYSGEKGIYNVHYLLERAGEYSVGITLNGGSIDGSPFTLLVLPGNINANATIASGPGLIAATAGESATFTVHGRDKYNNELGKGGEGSAVRVELEGPEDVTVDIHDVGNGDYTITYTAVQTGLYSAFVTVNDEPIKGSPFRDIRVRTSGASAGKSYAEGRGLEDGVVGVPTGFVIHARDTFGNPIPDGGDAFHAVLRGAAEVVPVVTDVRDGTYLVNYTATVAGDYAADVSVRGEAIGGSPFTFRMDPGPVSAAASTGEGPGVSRATSGVPSTALVRVKDEFGNVLSHGCGSVHSTLKNGDDVSVPVRVRDNDDGTYALSYTATRAGVAHLSVSIQGVAIHGSPFAVEVAPGPTSPFATTIEGSAVNQTRAGVPSRFVIQARDAFGNRRYEGGDAFSVELEGPTDVPATVNYISDGRYEVNYLVNEVGVYHLAIKHNGLYMMGHTYDLKVTPAPPVPGACFALGPALNHTTAGVDSTFVIRAADQFGNNITQGGEEFAVRMLGPGGAVVNPRVTDRDDGTYLVEYTITRTSPPPNDYYNVLIYTAGEYIKDSPSVLHVDAGPLVAANTAVWGDGLGEVPAGQETEFLLRTRDRFENYRWEGGDDVTVTMVGPEEDAKPTIKDEKNGIYHVTYKVVKAGTYFFDISINGAPVQKHSFNATVLAGPSSYKMTTTDLGDKPSLRTGQVVSFNVISKDEFGNQPSQGNEQIFVVVEGPQNLNAEVTDNGDGTYLAAFRVDRSGDYNITVIINGTPLASGPLLVSMNTGPGSPAYSFVDRLEDSVIVAGVPVRVVFHAYDGFNNSIRSGGDPFKVHVLGSLGPPALNASITDFDNGTFEATFIPTKAQGLEVSVSLLGKDIRGSPVRVVVEAAEPFAANCKAEGPGLVSGTAGEGSTFVLRTLDKFHNVRHRPEATNGFEGKLRVEDNLVLCNITDNTDGTYTVVYVPEKAGNGTLLITYNGDPVDQSPYTGVAISPGRHTSALGSAAEGPGLAHEVLAGDEQQFTIFARDMFNNTRKVGGDNFKVQIQGPVHHGDKIPTVSVTDNEDGTYTVTYRLHILGRYDIHISLLRDYGLKSTDGVKTNDTELVGSPFHVNVVPGAADPAHCTAEGNGLRPVITVGQPEQFVIRARDTYDSPHIAGGVNWIILIGGPEGDDGAGSGHVVDNGDGTYNVTYTIHKSGEHRIFVSLEDHPLHQIHNAPFVVTADAGQTEPGNSSASGVGLEPQLAGLVTSFSITSRDRFGNQRTIGGDKYSVTIEGVENVVPVVHDNENGVYTVKADYKKAGNYTIAVKIDEHHIKGSPFTKLVMAGKSDARLAEAMGSGINNTVVGATTTFKLFARDELGNFLRQGGLTNWAFQVSGPDSFHVTVTDNHDGSYTGTYTADKPGTYMVEILLDDFEITGSPYKVFVEFPTDPSKVEVQGPGEHGFQAGVETTFTIVSRTADGSPRRTGGDHYRVVITPILDIPKAETEKPVGEEADVVDNKDGTYTVSYTPKVSGRFDLDVQLGDHNVKDFKVDVKVGVTDPVLSKISGDGLRRATAGEVAHVTIVSFDKGGNRRTTGGDRIMVSFDPADSSRDEADVKDNHDGTYTVLYNRKLAGKMELVVRLNGINMACPTYSTQCAVTGTSETEGDEECSQFVVDVAPNVPFAATTYVEGAGVQHGMAGEDATFEVIVRDQYANRLDSGGLYADGTLSVTIDTPSEKKQTFDVVDHENAGYLVSYHPEVAGTYTVDVRIKHDPVKGSTFKPVIEPAAADPAQSILSFVGGRLAVVAGTQAQYVLHARDRFRNHLWKGGNDVTVVIEPTGFARLSPNCTVVDNRDGSYGVACGVYKVGAYVVEVLLEGQDVVGSGSNFTVLPAATKPLHSVVSSDFAPSVWAGRPYAFHVKTFDEFGNARTTGGDTITMTTSFGAAVLTEVTDHENGEFDVVYRLFRPDVDTADIRVNGVVVKEFPVDVRLGDRPVYSRFMTGDWIRENAVFDCEPAERRLSSDFALEFLSERGETYTKLFEVPFLDASGDQTDLEIEYLARVVFSVSELSNFSHPIVGLSDGENVVAFKRASVLESSTPLGTAIAGKDGLTLRDQTLFTPPSASKDVEDVRRTVELTYVLGPRTLLLASGGSFVEPLVWASPRPLDRKKSLTLVMFAASRTEQYSVFDVMVEVHEENEFHHFFSPDFLLATGLNEAEAAKVASRTMQGEALQVETREMEDVQGVKLFDVPVMYKKVLAGFPSAVHITAYFGGATHNDLTFGLTDGLVMEGFSVGRGHIGAAVAGDLTTFLVKPPSPPSSPSPSPSSSSPSTNTTTTANATTTTATTTTTTTTSSSNRLKWNEPDGGQAEALGIETGLGGVSDQGMRRVEIAIVLQDGQDFVLVRTSRTDPAVLYPVAHHLDRERPLSLVALAPSTHAVYTLYGIRVDVVPRQGFVRELLAYHRILSADVLHTKTDSGTFKDGRLVFGPRKGAGAKLLALPLLQKDQLTTEKAGVVARLVVTASALTEHNELTIGLTDGTHVVGFTRSDMAARNQTIGWVYAGRDGERLDVGGDLHRKAGRSASVFHTTFEVYLRLGETTTDVLVVAGAEDAPSVFRPDVHLNVHDGLGLVVFGGGAQDEYALYAIEATLFEEVY